ncbi:MAG: hypothetical protein KAH84_03995 [Thiomargarita sp.]|nr:hypothetical protein [Thiomargarita sp.]
MTEGKLRILAVLNTFTGRDGEPKGNTEVYILKAMWLMMLSEFEATIKKMVENYIDKIKRKNISEIHPCLLIRNFMGDKEEELTLNKIVSYYKKNPNEINYANFTKDRVPKYKSRSIVKLFNNLGLFFEKDEESTLHILDSIASTRDAIAHGDIGVEITRKQLKKNLDEIEKIVQLLKSKFNK